MPSPDNHLSTCSCSQQTRAHVHLMFWMLMASAIWTVYQQPPVSRLKYTSSVGAVDPCTAIMMMPPWSPTCNMACYTWMSLGIVVSKHLCRHGWQLSSNSIRSSVALH